MVLLAYGKTITNPRHFQKTSIVGQKKLRTLRKKASYQEETELTPTKTEVRLKETAIVEKYPIHLGQSILMESKMLLNGFVAFLMKFFPQETFRIAYTGNIFSSY